MTFLLYFIRFILLLCNVLTLAILVRIVVSWFSPGPTNMLTKMLYQITEPMLVPLRRIIPRVGPIDLTPSVAVIILQLIAYLLPMLISYFLPIEY